MILDSGNDENRRADIPDCDLSPAHLVAAFRKVIVQEQPAQILARCVASVAVTSSYPPLGWRAIQREGDRFAGVTSLLAFGHYRRGWNALAYARTVNEALPDGRDDIQLLAVLGVAFPTP